MERQILKDKNIRYSRNRIEILKLLEKSKQPLKITDIIRRIKKKNLSINRATVFRIVNLFKEKGILYRLDFGEGQFRYELSSLPHHHHFVCKNCGKILGVNKCLVSDSWTRETAMENSFRILGHRLDFFGLCVKCQ
ncbi:hypothetical protein A2Y99_01445 [Candidatus Gottesmanbacteria bacterium RBG_13_37_7]|uniref:Transcriptional repressor n=1 Tax=Candidatus Gottesmanbacteria bacterium RBG_13_37_7 TaxID=1798369 RepID=A0A1F5YJC5_9BACT|nr:MAG: hypothetical protein A2Y99_01445 [Candidatus Gottesmanbacteria bacterium RBG_13_37_7]